MVSAETIRKRASAIARASGKTALGPKEIVLACWTVKPRLVTSVLGIKDLDEVTQEMLVSISDWEVEAGWQDEDVLARVKSRMSDYKVLGVKQSVERFLTAVSRERDQDLRDYLAQLNELGHLVRHDIDESIDRHLRSVVDLQVAEPHKETPSDHPRPASAPPEPESITTAVDDLRKRFRDSIYGQSAALEHFADELQIALIRPARDRGLKGAFFLCGPSGCGKSETVRVLRDWYQDHESGLPFDGFVENPSFGETPPERSFVVIDAFQVQYQGFVGEFIANEIRSPVSSGVAESVILIGRLGQRLWSRLPFREQSILPSREHVCSILAQERVPALHPLTGEVSLQPGFLDLINSYVPFCELSYASAEGIFDAELRKLSVELESSGIALEIEGAVKALALFSAHYKRGFSGRQTLRAFQSHVEPHCLRLQSEGPSSIVIRSIDEKFNLAMERGRGRVLLIDDEGSEARHALERQLGDGVEVEVATGIDRGLEICSKNNFDLVFLDNYFEGQPRWREHLAAWRRHHPEVPAVILSSGDLTPEEKTDVDKIGGVLGFLRKDAPPESALLFVQHATWQARTKALRERYGVGFDRLLFDVTTDGDQILFNSVTGVLDDSEQPEESAAPVIPDTTREEIQDFLDLFLKPDRRSALDLAQPRGLLLHGPPGTGKTMIARGDVPVPGEMKEAAQVA